MNFASLAINTSIIRTWDGAAHGRAEQRVEEVVAGVGDDGEAADGLDGVPALRALL